MENLNFLQKTSCSMVSMPLTTENTNRMFFFYSVLNLTVLKYKKSIVEPIRRNFSHKMQIFNHLSSQFLLFSSTTYSV